MVDILKKAGLALVMLLIATTAFSGSTARQVDFLLAGLEKDGDPCTGCKVYTYETGTTTAKATYLDRLKAGSQTNPVILDSEGRAEVFADGLYKMVIKNADDTSYFDIDGMDYGQTGATFTALSQYDGLAEAIADIGGTETVLVMDTTSTLNANLTIPTNVTLHVFQYDSVDLNGKTLTMNGSIVAPPIEWIVGSSGTLTGSPIVQYWDPTWLKSGLTDTSTLSYKAIQMDGVTITSATINTVGAVSNRIVFSNTVSFSKGSDIASATALQLGADGNYFDVTGTTGITSISGRSIGTAIKLHFDGAVTITTSTNIENIGAVDITTVAGDEAELIEYASGQWRMTTYSGHIAASFRGALVYNSGGQSLADDSVTSLKFNSESYDTDSIHDNVTNNTRLTVPVGITKVRLTGQTYWNPNSVGIRTGSLGPSPGTFYGRTVSIQNALGGGEDTVLPFSSGVISVTGGDYFELRAAQNSGGALIVTGSDQTWFAMEIIE